MNQIDIIIDDVENNPDEWRYWDTAFRREILPFAIKLDRTSSKCKLFLNSMPITINWWENIKLLAALNGLERHKLLTMTNNLQDVNRSLPMAEWIEKREAGEI